jgi:hypothetical protein
MVEIDRRISLRFLRFNSGELGGNGTVVSLGGGGGFCLDITLEYVLGSDLGSSII